MLPVVSEVCAVFVLAIGPQCGKEDDLKLRGLKKRQPGLVHFFKDFRPARKCAKRLRLMASAFLPFVLPVFFLCRGLFPAGVRAFL